MKIYGLVVCRNEADRYLEEFLLYHFSYLHQIAIYDDQSTDRTVAIAKGLGSRVKVRTDNEPSFLEHEGKFRQNAWGWMEEAFEPSVHDWVCVLDCDEFLVRSYKGFKTDLFELVDTAENQNKNSISVKIPEVFSIDNEGKPWVRTDGFWGDLFAPRVCQYRPNATYRNVSLACGSVPDFAQSFSIPMDGVSILHYGYAKASDRITKYERYKDRPGHNPLHIESILQRPTLELWQGSNPMLEIA